LKIFVFAARINLHTFNSKHKSCATGVKGQNLFLQQTKNILERILCLKLSFITIAGDLPILIHEIHFSTALLSLKKIAQKMQCVS